MYYLITALELVEHRILIRDSKKVNSHKNSIIKSGRSGNSRNFFWRRTRERAMEQYLGPELTKRIDFLDTLWISRKFLREAYRHGI